MVGHRLVRQNAGGIGLEGIDIYRLRLGDAAQPQQQNDDTYTN
jgi:hypothetical protein